MYSFAILVELLIVGLQPELRLVTDKRFLGFSLRGTKLDYYAVVVLLIYVYRYG